jgi:hypothetical protein
MSKFLPCKKVCPVVAELKHDVANRDQEIGKLLKRISILTLKCAENDKRLAKIRQAAFGIVDWGIED